MSIFFAMAGEGERAHPAFYLTRKAAPADAIEISEKRHAQLVAALSAGRKVSADARGRPVIARAAATSAAAVRAQLRTRIQREAARRIASVSPEWRQLNDLREPSEAGAVRFARVDAIRAASNAIEELADKLPAEDLGGFPVADHPLWPKFD
jgi:hypothetical protein